ncbi:MAG: tyrosine-type recombinase/integrase [Candidatus Faecousia sp.]|nr:tyrosine-type recombinase/integrase [Candidatus Faecousia sp.]
MASIDYRNGSFRITVSLGYDIYGKRIRETATFVPDQNLSPKKQRKSAEEFAAQFEAQIKNGMAMDGRKITLKEFTDRWLAEYADQKLQPGTVEKYRAELEEKVLPALGHLKLSELRPHNLNAFLVGMTKDGARKDGKPGGYSKGSIAKTRNVLSSVLRTATEWEIIDRNTLDKVRPQAEDAAEKLKFFTPEQAATFLAYIEQPYTVKTHGHKRIDDTGKEYTVGNYESERTIPEQLRVLFILAIYAGLRKGELLALEWSDIDFENDTIHVSKSVSVVAGQQITKAPKTKNSCRIVSIPAFLTQRLRSLKAERTRYRLSLGDYWQGADWVFIQDNGKQMSYSTPYSAFQDTIARYNAGKPAADQLPAIPFHGLRHTSATLLIASKQDVRTVASRLGHAQASTTMNIYAHALQETDKKAAAALENMLVKHA